MSKKISRGMFMFLCTIFSILLMVGVFFTLYGLVMLICYFFSFLKDYILYIMLGVIIATIIITLIIYSKVIKWVIKKWNLEEEFRK